MCSPFHFHHRYILIIQRYSTILLHETFTKLRYLMTTIASMCFINYVIFFSETIDCLNNNDDDDDDENYDYNNNYSNDKNWYKNLYVDVLVFIL